MDHVNPHHSQTVGSDHSYAQKSLDLSGAVMSVLCGIRPLQSDGRPYDGHTNLSDAGFTSIEMVKVMLGVEAAFDLMIPQEHITPENFATPESIAAMIRQLTSQA